MYKLTLLFILFFCFANAQLSFLNKDTDLGTIAEAYEIKGDIILKNEGDKKIFLLRADADKHLKVFASKKTLQVGDTCLLVISFIPNQSGKFKKKISLVASNQGQPYELTLSGSITKIKADDKLACFYFGNRKNSNVKVIDEPIVVKENKEPRDNSNKIPDNVTLSGVEGNPTATKNPTTNISSPITSSNELSLLEYKPNNILFLVDVSSSMKDSLKLPVMKKALHTLIDAVRDVDKITFVTYADSVKIIKENISGSDKTTLHNLVNNLKARGLTKGNKAILFSQGVAQKHFIAEGNNQLFLATDGKFRFYPDDQKKWLANQATKKIILSTVAFGNDREAMHNLKEIAEIGEGSFIHIKHKNSDEEKLLNEIKKRSKRTP
jgi:hypothetical protein